MRYFYLIFCLVFTHVAYSQTDKVWILGDMALDFNAVPASQIKVNGPYFSEASASVSDDDGQLLFYTDGSRVWDRHHTLMPNGASLTPDIGIATGSSTQGTCIIPIPGHPDEYYVFSLSSIELGENAGRLYYSRIDMRLNNGLGDVVNSEKGVFLASAFNEKMTPVVGDRCNIWVIVRDRSANQYRSFEVTSAGVNHNAVISPVGIINFNYHILGTLTASPNGRKLLSAAAHIGGGGLEVLDFDQSTGILSNPVLLEGSKGIYSACFSPDQTKAYAMNYLYDGDINQYDLTSGDPSATKTLIKRSDFNFDKIKLAPDGKVYFKGKINTLDAIGYPNFPGISCGYQADAIVFDTSISGALPNTVPYFHQGEDALTVTAVTAPCWANVNQLVLNPVNTAEGWDYIWHDGETVANRVIDTPGTYWLSYYTPACNYNVDTFHVSFPNGVFPDIEIENSCNGADNGKARASTYPGDTVTYHYVWSDEDGDILSFSDTLTNVPSGNYILNIRTAGCDTTLSFFLPDEERRVSFTADSIICQGTELSFINTSDSGFMKLLWDFGDQDSSSLGNPSHVYDRAGAYKVTLTGTGQVCKDSIMKTIVVDSMFSGAFLMDRDSICTGESIVFFPQTDSSTLSLNWNFGDGIQLTLDNERQIRHAYAAAGLMPVKLTMQFRACPDTSFTDSVYVEALPPIDLGPDAGLCLNGSPVILRNLQGLPVGDHYYLWSTGDTSESLKAVHPGIYSLTVKTTLLGCSNTESVTVREDCYMDIPNAFTPNGDGTNDYFFPRQLLSKSVTDFKMQVFNRWGQLVFETNSIAGRGWDGKFNGNDQPGGVYIYRITAIFKEGNEERYEGNVTLLR